MQWLVYPIPSIKGNGLRPQTIESMPYDGAGQESVRRIPRIDLAIY